MRESETVQSVLRRVCRGRLAKQRRHSRSRPVRAVRGSDHRVPWTDRSRGMADAQFAAE